MDPNFENNRSSNIRYEILRNSVIYVLMVMNVIMISCMFENYSYTLNVIVLISTCILTLLMIHRVYKFYYYTYPRLICLIAITLQFIAIMYFIGMIITDYINIIFFCIAGLIYLLFLIEIILIVTRKKNEMES